MLSNWPITPADACKALGTSLDKVDAADLQLYIDATTELIDQRTGRIDEPNRWVTAAGLEGGAVPHLFVLSAREVVKLWWQQSHNGPRGARQGDVGELAGPPMGADLPRKVEGWLASFMDERGFA